MRQDIKERIEQIKLGKVPEGYQHTASGIVPIDWKIEKLEKHLLEHDELSNNTEDFPVVTSSREGLMLQSVYYKQQRFDETRLGFHVVPKGYITYRHMSDDDVFRFNINDIAEKVLVSSEYPVFTTRTTLLKYLLVSYLNTSPYFLSYCREQKKGSTRTRMYFKNLKQFVMPISHTAEQNKIAEILTHCDKVIALKERLIAEKCRQKKWLMQNLLNPDSGVRLPGFEGSKWDSNTLIEMSIDIIDGDWIESKDQSDEGIRLIQTGNIGVGIFIDKSERARYIDEKTFLRLHCSEVFPGDILVSRLPDPIGRACVLPRINCRTITAVDCTIVRFRKQSQADFFLQYSCSDSYFRNISVLSGGSTRTRISRKELECLNIPMPKSEKEQEAITNVLFTADREIDLLEQELVQWKAKKKALMQLLLTGLVRV